MRPPRGCRRLVATVLAVAAVSAACSDQGESADPAASAPDLPRGTSVVAEGLDGPTQIVAGPDGSLVVAQLNGPEGEPTGQVLELDPESGDTRVLLEGLDTPTGVLWLDDHLWVMQRRSLSVARWDGEGDPESLRVVLEELPFNGRSEGTLTALPDGRLLYETSGSIRDGDVVGGSGVLWVLDPRTEESEPLATGLKNAYAHAVLGDGSVLTTEIGDNVTDPPPDELQLFDPPGVDATDATVPDGGWPDCPPPGQCPGVTGPLALFPAGSTPTGVALIDGRSFVALFVTGSVLEVDPQGWAQGDGPRSPATVLEGLEGPHTLLATPDGELLISEHLSGRILSWRP